MNDIFTIGHSNHAAEVFLALLGQHGITALADVRSHPASKRFPQFDKKTLQASLEAAGIRYVFLGQGLGARPSDPQCYTEGRADFAKMRTGAPFQAALERLQRGAQEFRICLLCAEREPADCHRTWLVAQTLHDTGVAVQHIHADGQLETHANLLRRLAGSADAGASLFDDEASTLAMVATREARRVAWQAHTVEEDA